MLDPDVRTEKLARRLQNLDAAIRRGLADAEAARVHSVNGVRAEMQERFGELKTHDCVSNLTRVGLGFSAVKVTRCLFAIAKSPVCSQCVSVVSAA
jgi:hypothetical protein